MLVFVILWLGPQKCLESRNNRTIITSEELKNVNRKKESLWKESLMMQLEELKLYMNNMLDARYL